MIWAKRFSFIRRRKSGRKGSILLYSVLMIVVAGSSVVTWLGYLGQVQRNAALGQSRMHALYAAEAGVEQVVDYLNNPANYLGAVPQEYDTALQTSPYSVGGYNIHPGPYDLFEPYIVRVATNDDGVPTDLWGNVIVDSYGNLLEGEEPVILEWTYLRDPADPESSKIPTFDVDLANNSDLILADEEGDENARVTRLTFINPADFRSFGDPTLADMGISRAVIGKVVAEAVTPRGTDVIVEVLLGDNETLSFRAGGAIISSASADFNGQFNVHWGDVWAKGDIPLPNNFHVPAEVVHIPTESEDPWMKVRTAGMLWDSASIEYADGRQTDGFGPNPLVSTDPNYYVPFLDDTLYRDDKGRSTYEDYENLRQHQVLEFPSYDYETWKEFFLVNGLPYYWTGADGLIYGVDRDPRSLTYGQVIGQDYDAWFHIEPNDPDYWNVIDQMVFVDTIPTDSEGNPIPDPATALTDPNYVSRPPADDGSNLATVVSAGEGTHSRGMMFLVAHMDFRGQGNPPTAGTIHDPEGNDYVLKPDGSAPIGKDARFKVNHNGIFFAWGNVINSGNRTFYGSIFTREGFLGSGSREVYYNARLKDGSWLNTNQSTVRRLYWQVRDDYLPPLS